MLKSLFSRATGRPAAAATETLSQPSAQPQPLDDSGYLATPQPADSPLNRTLEEVAQRGLAQMTLEAVTTVAMSVWYGDEDLEPAVLEGPHGADAARLVARLAYYNVVPQDRKKALLEGARQALATYRTQDHAVFESAFRVFLPQLQPLQTRHFAATQTEAA